MTRSATVTCSRAAGQLELLKPPPLLHGHQVTSRRDAVVIEHGLDALLPLAALVDERVAQAHAGAQIEKMRRRNPRLRQPPDHDPAPGRCRASARSVLARFLLQRRKLVSAGSRTCTAA